MELLVNSMEHLKKKKKKYQLFLNSSKMEDKGNFQTSIMRPALL